MCLGRISSSNWREISLEQTSLAACLFRYNFPRSSDGRFSAKLQMARVDFSMNFPKASKGSNEALLRHLS